MFARNVSAVLAVLVAVLFAAAFAVEAFEYSESAHAPFSYTGKIVGIDPAYRILTVQAGPKDEAYFVLRDDAAVTMCDKDMSFSDLKIGDTVTISYFQESLGGANHATYVEAGMKC